ncbi:MAG: S8/S53 family peptidase, partial [Desulfocapsaceae bacterium]|nr:S8/S53 family peptidase [Desulfocapsaceae bacterium]
SITPQQAAEILTSVEEIEGAEPDYVYRLERNQKIDSPLSSERPLEAETSVQLPLVAVLDSGLSQLYSASPFVSAYYDAFSSTQHAADTLGHGTQMSLVASGMVAPRGTENKKIGQNRVVAVRTIDDNGFTSTATLLKSIDYAIAADARVISMSWGTEESGQMLEKAVRYASDRGLVLVAAAGNRPTGIAVYPAAYKNVIGVGALLPDGSVWEESNRGDFVSVYGFGIAEMPVGYNGSPGVYAGTSISTAYIANQVAHILQTQPDSDISEIITALKGNVSPEGLQ